MVCVVIPQADLPAKAELELLDPSVLLFRPNEDDDDATHEVVSVLLFRPTRLRPTTVHASVSEASSALPVLASPKLAPWHPEDTEEPFLL